MDSTTQSWKFLLAGSCLVAFGLLTSCTSALSPSSFAPTLDPALVFVNPR